MSALALDDEQRDYVRRVRETARRPAPPGRAGHRGPGQPAAPGRDGPTGDCCATSSGAPPTSRCATPRRCGSACCARPSRRSRAEAETALALQGLGSYPILQSGSPETVERWIPGVVAGTTVAAFALTEPEAGSDAAALSLRAEPRRRRLAAPRREALDLQRPRGRRLHGLRPHHRGRRSARGVTAFAVAGDAPGLSGEHLELLSPHPIGRLLFDGVRVGGVRRPRRGRRRLPGRDAHARPVPAQRRRLRRRHGPGRARRHPRPRRDPPRVRRPAGRAAVGGPHPGRPGHPAGGGPAAGLRGRHRLRRRRRPRHRHQVRRPWPSCSPPRRPSDRRPVRAAARRPRPPARPPARAPLPRRPGAADLRGRLGGAALDHRPRAVQREDAPRDPLPRLGPADHDVGPLRLRGRRAPSPPSPSTAPRSSTRSPSSRTPTCATCSPSCRTTPASRCW